MADETDERGPDDLTPSEEETVEDTGMDGEEAHRYGEFEDLNHKLDSLVEMVDSLSDSLSDVMKTIVDSGATIRDSDGDGSIIDDVVEDITDMNPSLDDLDLNL